MLKAMSFIISKYFICTVLLLTFLGACTLQKNTTTPTPEPQQLRITNSGNTDIKGLIVLFPGSSSIAEAILIEFGDIDAGQTTTYRSVSSGIYAYAAYSYRIDNREVNQAVMDWVGESPLVGKKFTYQIALNLKKVEGEQMQLIDVLIDEP